MLHRAATNAYSWWWASHIRTKQSKWLEQCLQDMEEKVGVILKLIDDDGDSFAKRAEMYYRRRPELISSVEEAFKSFRALADRYDLLSKELQNANHTIATVFPEQVQFQYGEDEDFPIPKDAKNFPIAGSNVPPNLLEVPSTFPPHIPEAPPSHGLKGIISPASHQFKRKKASQGENRKIGKVKSGLMKDEALEEIKKLQKEILALQTVKEFFKSSYENGVAKYWEIENQIIDMQQRVLELQDEFNIGAVIEDDEARTLMAEAALKSCEEALTTLQAKQDKLIEDARQEFTRIETACDRVKSLRDKYISNDDELADGEKMDKVGGKLADGEKMDKVEGRSAKDVAQMIQDTKGVQALLEKPKESSDLGDVSTLTMSQMVEKIDQLVNKVISLETAVSTQNSLVDTLKRETEDLHSQIHNLEGEKESLIEHTNELSSRVKEMEERLSKLQDLNRNVESQHSNIQMDFAQARSSLDHLSGKLHCVKPDDEAEETKPDDEAEETDASHDEVVFYVVENNVEEKLNDHRQVYSNNEVEQSVEDNEYVAQLDKKGESSVSTSVVEDAEDVKEVALPNVEASQPSEVKLEQTQNGIKKSLSLPTDTPDGAMNGELQKNAQGSEELSWQEILLSGVEDREMILLKEYTTILRCYKDAKRKLNDMEKKEKDSEFDITLRMRELKKAILKRDEEIQYLRQRLEGKGSVNNEEITSTITDSFASNEDVDAKEDDNVDKGEEIKSILMDRHPSLSKVEGKLRVDIDAILEENLDFWLRFSTAYHQVRKFKTQVEDLQNEAWKLKEKRKPDGSSSSSIKSDVKAIKNHLREIQTELTVWLDQSVSLKDELESRSRSMYNIQEEITRALREGAEEDEIRFSSLQAAKFQGEILSMKQESNKVREELQACLDHVKVLKFEIEKTITELNEDFGISSEQPESSTRVRIPLRAFLFGNKKKQKPSIFSRIHQSKRHQVFKNRE